MAKLSLAELKAAVTKRVAVVDVPCEELGGTVGMRAFAAAEGLAIGKRWRSAEKAADGSFADEGEKVALLIEILASSIVGEDGELMLNSDEGRDVLRSMGAGTITQLGGAALRVNGFIDDPDPT